MTARRLQITRLHATKFGGLRDTTVDFTDEPFVVVHGRNETGKSTMVEAIVWLLTKMPETKVDEQLLRRLRSDGGTLNADLDWRLDEDEYHTRATFQLARYTVAKSSRVEIRGPSGVLDVNAFSGLLGGGNYDAFTNVFRIRGEDAHTEHKNSIDLVRDTVHGGSHDAVSAPEAITALGEAIKTLTTKKAKDSRSVKQLATQLGALQRELDEAGSNSEEFQKRTNEVAELESNICDIDERLSASNARYELLAAAHRAKTTYQVIQRVRTEQEMIEPADQAWAPLAERLEEFDAAIDDARSAQGRVDDTDRELHRHLSTLGVPWNTEMLGKCQITPATIGELNRRFGAWSGLLDTSGAAQRKVSSLLTELAAATAAESSADSRWRSLEPDTDPIGWLNLFRRAEEPGRVRIGTPAGTDSSNSTASTLILVIALAGAAAAAAGLSGGAPVAGILGLVVAGVAGYVWRLLTQHALTGADTAAGLPTVGEASTEARRKAAEIVEQARSVVADHERDLAIGQSDAEAARLQQQEAEKEIAALLTHSGITLPVPPEHTVAIAEQVLGAKEAEREAIESRQRLAEAAHSLALLVERTPDGWSDRPVNKIREEAARQLALVEKADSIDRELSDARSALSRDLAGNDQAQELLDEHDGDALHRLLTAEDTTRNDLREQRDEFKKEEGRLQVLLASLGSSEELQLIRFRYETLHAEAGEQLVEALIAKATHTLIDEAVRQFERDNQPEIVQVAQQLITRVTPRMSYLHTSPGTDSFDLRVEDPEGVSLADEVLSTGARALLYLCLRLAAADHESEKRGVHLPLLLDDALVHLDDDRLGPMIEVLAEQAAIRQILLFTCHQRTVDAAVAHGAQHIDLEVTGTTRS